MLNTRLSRCSSVELLTKIFSMFRLWQHWKPQGLSLRGGRLLLTLVLESPAKGPQMLLLYVMFLLPVWIRASFNYSMSARLMRLRPITTKNSVTKMNQSPKNTPHNWKATVSLFSRAGETYLWMTRLFSLSMEHSKLQQFLLQQLRILSRMIRKFIVLYPWRSFLMHKENTWMMEPDRHIIHASKGTARLVWWCNITKLFWGGGKRSPTYTKKGVPLFPSHKSWKFSHLFIAFPSPSWFYAFFMNIKVLQVAKKCCCNHEVSESYVASCTKWKKSGGGFGSLSSTGLTGTTSLNVLFK